MDFIPALSAAILQRRYKRFLADVRVGDAPPITIHCPNTGAMLGCKTPGARVFMSRSDNPKRKYRHTWELVEVAGGVLVGVNTGRSNALVAEAIAAGRIAELAGYDAIEREVTCESGSRLDFRLRAAGRRDCWVEVKNVSAAVATGSAFFPDAVSVRAARHLEVLTRRVAAGERAVLIYCVQRGDVNEVHPADEIDPAYGIALRHAAAAGVELGAYRASVTPERIELDTAVSVVLAARGAPDGDVI